MFELYQGDGWKYRWLESTVDSLETSQKPATAADVAARNRPRSSAGIEGSGAVNIPQGLRMRNEMENAKLSGVSIYTICKNSSNYIQGHFLHTQPHEHKCMLYSFNINIHFVASNSKYRTSKQRYSRNNFNRMKNVLQN